MTKSFSRMNATLVAFFIFVQGCSDKAGLDFSDPVKVVEEIFRAAKTGNTVNLSSLCHPTGRGDRDVKEVCAVHKKHKNWNSFYKWFVRGRVVSEAKINGNRAKVKILFGPRGDKPETMNLELHNGKWHIMSF